MPDASKSEQLTRPPYHHQLQNPIGLFPPLPATSQIKSNPARATRPPDEENVDLDEADELNSDKGSGSVAGPAL